MAEKPKAKTKGQRVHEYRKRLCTQGWSTHQVVLDPPATKALAKLIKKQKGTKISAIRGALVLAAEQV